MESDNSHIFSTYKVGNLLLKNRLVVAPMTRVSANEDGTAGPLMRNYYRSFADGDFSLIITEGIYTDKLHSQGYKFQPGLTDERQSQSWCAITESVHQRGGLIIAQLMHAGALSQYSKYTSNNIAPSAVKPLGQEMSFYYGEGDYSTPREMTEDDIENVIDGFINAAKLAQLAGFDGVEIHGANGYLLDQFITVYTNDRADKYGGDITNRIRIYKRIITSVRKAVGDNFIVGVRFSQSKVNDPEYKWPEKDLDAKYIFQSVNHFGVDYIHTTELDANSPAFDDGLSLAELAKKHGGTPVIANGGINNESDAKQLIETNQADIISLGKMALANPSWPNIVQSKGELKEFNFDIFNPIADLKTANKFFENNT